MIKLARCLLVLTAAFFSTGCAALSLFTTTHEHHYENNPALEQRVEALEQRLAHMEHQGAASLTLPGPALNGSERP